MKKILKRLPILRGIIAKREQAELERQAAAAWKAWLKECESKSEAQLLRELGCSEADARFMLKGLI